MHNTVTNIECVITVTNIECVINVTNIECIITVTNMECVITVTNIECVITGVLSSYNLFSVMRDMKVTFTNHGTVIITCI